MYKTLYNYRHIWELKTAVRYFVRAYQQMRRYPRTDTLHDKYLEDALHYQREFRTTVNTMVTMSSYYNLSIPCADLCDLMDLSDRMFHLALYHDC